MNRYKPVGWRNDSYRHSLAARGIKTKYSFMAARYQVPHWLLDKLNKNQREEAEKMLFEDEENISAVAEHFGIKHFQKGLQKKQQVFWSREQKIDFLRGLREELGRVPVHSDIIKLRVEGEDIPSPSGFKGEESWEDLIRAAGMEPEKPSFRMTEVSERVEKVGKGVYGDSGVYRKAYSSGEKFKKKGAEWFQSLPEEKKQERLSKLKKWKDEHPEEFKESYERSKEKLRLKRELDLEFLEKGRESSIKRLKEIKSDPEKHKEYLRYHRERRDVGKGEFREPKSFESTIRAVHHGQGGPKIRDKPTISRLHVVASKLPSFEKELDPIKEDLPHLDKKTTETFL